MKIWEENFNQEKKSFCREKERKEKEERVNRRTRKEERVS
jgi:hypothetical protein